jgi:hypothetical protein
LKRLHLNAAYSSIVRIQDKPFYDPCPIEPDLQVENLSSD